MQTSQSQSNAMQSASYAHDFLVMLAIHIIRPVMYTHQEHPDVKQTRTYTPDGLE